MQARSSLILFSLFIILCSTYASGKVITGAERMDQYLPLIKGKRVGMVVNHTSIVGTEPIHLLDTLLKQKIDIVKVFAPEHGFRGNADAGETVKDGKVVPMRPISAARRKRQPYGSNHRLALRR